MGNTVCWVQLSCFRKSLPLTIFMIVVTGISSENNNNIKWHYLEYNKLVKIKELYSTIPFALIKFIPLLRWSEIKSRNEFM